MNLENFNVNVNQVATVVTEHTFWIGEDANIEVVVDLYEHNGSYQIMALLNGSEEIDTIDYEGSIDDTDEVLATMEKLVNDNEDYILDLALWND